MRRIIAIAAIGILLAACSKNEADFNGLQYYMNSETSAIPSGDKYEEFSDNPFINTSEQNVSTFSVDADGASYANMRSYVNAGYLPDVNSVRIEEFLNYFTFDYPEPEGEHSVAINAELGDCPWNAGHKLLRLGIKGKSVPSSQMPKANYVFLIDVSGSMNSKDKLPLLQSGLKTLTDNLNQGDRISIITYSGSVRKVLESTFASDSRTIKNSIDKLVASGSTAGGAAMKMAYEEAVENFIEGGNNRVIMGTDGDFNVGVTDSEQLVEMVETYAKKGIYLTVCGFGRGNLNDAMMESISNKGNGTYEYIDTEDELTKIFVRERGKLYSVANDSKVQVSFDAGKVAQYRLIGYENRVMSKEDFENDEKDAGEIGSGQTITALYEIVPAEGYDLKDPVGTFEFRYKKALGDKSLQLSLQLPALSAEKSANMSFAAGVAAFGMILRKSPYKGDATLAMSEDLVKDGLAFDPYGYRKQLLDLIGKAKEAKIGTLY